MRVSHQKNIPMSIRPMMSGARTSTDAQLAVEPVVMPNMTKMRAAVQDDIRDFCSGPTDRKQSLAYM
jgi:hypothetical protein